MRLVGLVCVHNERFRGNLPRCLVHLWRYCDAVVIYDDGSSDGSGEYAIAQGCEVIRGDVPNLAEEVQHRQAALDRAQDMGADWVWWLDADEVLDAPGERGIREYLEVAAGRGVGGVRCQEVNLWRSQSWERVDYPGRSWFLRGWRVPSEGRLVIPPARGLHRQLWPAVPGPVEDVPYRVLHWGYATVRAIERRWRERTAYGVPTDFRRRGLDERQMQLERVPREWFPEGLEPPDNEPAPEPIRYAGDIMREAGL